MIIDHSGFCHLSRKLPQVHQLTCCVSIPSLATWVGGAFIVGTVEMVYTPSLGLTRTVIMLLAYSSSFIIGEA